MKKPMMGAKKYMGEYATTPPEEHSQWLFYHQNSNSCSLDDLLLDLHIAVISCYGYIYHQVIIVYCALWVY